MKIDTEKDKLKGVESVDESPVMLTAKRNDNNICHPFVWVSWRETGFVLR